MPMGAKTYELPKQIERLLAALSKLYAQDGKRSHQQIIVNATVRVHEEWSVNTDFDSDSVGHALYLVLPDALFLPIVKIKDKLREQIRKDLNSLQNVPGEYFADVFLEMDAPAESDWRAASGLSLVTSRTVTGPQAKRIWADESFRLFLSHKAQVKEQVGALKDALRVFGVSAFVAHEDIHPTREWREEIENALATMDGFAALLTSDFHDSDWTDQEVGYALARGVPMIAVRLGRDPYGFIGKFQALSCSWADAPIAVVRILMKKDRMVSAYIAAARACTSFDLGNTLSAVLADIEKLSEKQVDELVAAYNENYELRGSFGFNGSWSAKFGDGLVPHLNRLSSRTFDKTADSSRIEQVVPF